MGFSLMHVALAMLRACHTERRWTVQAATALDVWSLGIIAVEMFSCRCALGAFTTADQVRNDSYTF